MNINSYSANSLGRKENVFMDEKILLGRDRQIIEFPEAEWKQQLARVADPMSGRLSFMTAEHHRVRYFVVRELVNTGKPIRPGTISEMLGLPPEQVSAILDELERKLFFLVRDAQGAVAWAYPVTVEPTPHRLYFSTGERLFGA
jgi:hypothetical protein